MFLPSVGQSRQCVAFLPLLLQCSSGGTSKSTLLPRCDCAMQIVLEKMEGDGSWALVTFRHERSILKAVSQPIEAGVNVLIPHRAIFQQVVSMNDATVRIQRGWSEDRAEVGSSKPGSGLTGAMAGLKGARAPAAKEVRETPDEVAARLSRSLKVRWSIDGGLECIQKFSVDMYVRAKHEDVSFSNFCTDKSSECGEDLRSTDSHGQDIKRYVRPIL